jgi:outer membrane receptor for ferrienterochelin and colicins
MRTSTRVFSMLMLLAATPLNMPQAAQANDDDKTLDDLLSLDIEGLTMVTIASKKEEKLSDAPGIITVITRKDIETYGARDITDVLRRVPGLFVAGARDIRGGTNSIRGQQSSSFDKHLLILLNGRPMREAYTSGLNNTIFTGFPMDAIQRLEIIRGPGSVLYGSGAFEGVLNIVTRKPEAGTKQTFGTSYGSFNTSQQNYTLENGGDAVDVFAAAQFTSSDGFDWNGFSQSGDYISDRAAYQNFSGTAQLDYKNLTLSAFEGSAADQLSPSGTTTALRKVENRRRFFDVGYKNELPYGWEAQANFTYGGSSVKYESGNLDGSSHDMLGELMLSGGIVDDLDLMVGTTYDDLRSSDKTPNGVKSHSVWKSTYFQFGYTPLDFLKLTAAGQFNDVGSGSYEFSPRISAVANFNTSWGAKLLYAEAFRSPSGFEKTLNIPGVIRGTSGLQPETIATLDAQVFYHDDKYEVALTYFRSAQENTITVGFVPADNMLRFINSGELDYTGFELEGKMNINDNWGLEGSVSHNMNKSSSGEKDTKFVPNFLGKLGINYTNNNGVVLGVFNNYMGEPGAPPSGSAVDGAANTNEDGSDYLHVTANLSLDLNQVLELSTGVPEMKFSLFGDNLLESDPIYFTAVEASSARTLPAFAGRSMYGRLSVSF